MKLAKIPQMSSKIPDTHFNSVRTAEDRQTAIAVIEVMMENVFVMDSSKYDEAGINTRPDIAQEIKEKLGLDSDNSGSAGAESTREKLRALKESLQSMPVLRLELAIRPGEAVIDSVCNWVRDNLGSNYVMDIEVDRELIGGAVVVLGGNYINESLERIFDDMERQIMTIIDKEVASEVSQ